MSRLLDSVKATISASRLSTPIRRAAAFAHCTAVASCRLGLSMTLIDERIFAGDNSRPVRHAGRVETLGLNEVLTWTDSTQPIERSIGVAALNSCIPLAGQRYFAGNALDLLAAWADGKKVVMVGGFPNVERIRERARSFQILERRPRPGDVPADEYDRIVPECDILAMTGVTCLNDTIEGLLAAKRPDARCIVLGPTVPLSKALFALGVDVVGGAWVDNENDAWATLAHGGTARTTGGLRTVLMAKDPSWLQGWPELTPPPDHPETRGR